MKEVLIIVLLVLFAGLLLYFISVNRKIVVSHYQFKAPDDLTIVHLTDVHNTHFGKDDCELLGAVRQADPDYIFITGDLLNKRNPDEEDSYRLIEKLLEIAPIYFVWGNHEQYLEERGTAFVEGLKQRGVHVLVNESVMLDHKIQLAGLEDIYYISHEPKNFQREHVSNLLQQTLKPADYTILLVHQPQLFDVYQQYDIDLVLAGHTHGGVIRLPLIGGVVAPNQGLFPKYDAGLFEKNNTTMLISRGLGKSIIPVRVLCRPEVIVIQLKKEK